ncbi:unnamed protein product [Bursaphelenchus okinawaensis]|uniref:Uncharacterized protein n=1 Tax=Bursaphelenchus okinawaensis TaxID=465554 RepID=A0A811KQE9_9BILA|nr:unnamed protein product [Bursaphelenchus okinawaensis]CAG9110371.1 unnamed protein product [Bursaphelenchus okinawaensis]
MASGNAKAKTMNGLYRATEISSSVTASVVIRIFGSMSVKTVQYKFDWLLWSYLVDNTDDLDTLYKLKLASHKRIECPKLTRLLSSLPFTDYCQQDHLYVKSKEEARETFLNLGPAFLENYKKHEVTGIKKWLSCQSPNYYGILYQDHGCLYRPIENSFEYALPVSQLPYDENISYSLVYRERHRYLQQLYLTMFDTRTHEMRVKRVEVIERYATVYSRTVQFPEDCLQSNGTVYCRQTRQMYDMFFFGWFDFNIDGNVIYFECCYDKYGSRTLVFEVEVEGEHYVRLFNEAAEVRFSMPVNEYHMSAQPCYIDNPNSSYGGYFMLYNDLKNTVMLYHCDTEKQLILKRPLMTFGHNIIVNTDLGRVVYYNDITQTWNFYSRTVKKMIGYQGETLNIDRWNNGERVLVTILSNTGDVIQYLLFITVIEGSLLYKSWKIASTLTFTSER